MYISLGKNRVFKLAILLFVTLCPPASADWAGFHADRCARLLEAWRAYALGIKTPLHPDLEKAAALFFQATGLRAGYLAPGTRRPILATYDALEIPSMDGSKRLRIEIVKNSTEKEPWIENDLDVRTLKIPEGFDVRTLSDEGHDAIRQFLMGHPLHPFIYHPPARAERAALGEPELLLKEVQHHAIEVGEEILRRIEQKVERGEKLSPEERKYLVIAPTGVGKTEILKAIMRKRLEAKQKLHILIADQNYLVKQLKGDMEALQKEGKKFKIVRWGGVLAEGEEPPPGLATFFPT